MERANLPAWGFGFAAGCGRPEGLDCRGTQFGERQVEHGTFASGDMERGRPSGLDCRSQASSVSPGSSASNQSRGGQGAFAVPEAPDVARLLKAGLSADGCRKLYESYYECYKASCVAGQPLGLGSEVSSVSGDSGASGSRRKRGARRSKKVQVGGSDVSYSVPSGTEGLDPLSSGDDRRYLDVVKPVYWAEAAKELGRRPTFEALLRSPARWFMLQASQVKVTRSAEGYRLGHSGAVGVLECFASVARGLDLSGAADECLARSPELSEVWLLEVLVRKAPQPWARLD